MKPREQIGSTRGAIEQLLYSGVNEDHIFFKQRIVLFFGYEFVVRRKIVIFSWS